MLKLILAYIHSFLVILISAQLLWYFGQERRSSEIQKYSSTEKPPERSSQKV